MHSNPLDDLENILDRIDQGIDVPMPGTASLDLVDQDNEYLVVMDLPGYDPDELDVTFSDGRLQVSGERAETVDVEEEQYVRRERRQATVNRTVTIPDRIEKDEITATYTDGVLEVTLPKAEDEDNGHEITIEG